MAIFLHSNFNLIVITSLSYWATAIVWLCFSLPLYAYYLFFDWTNYQHRRKRSEKCCLKNTVAYTICACKYVLSMIKLQVQNYDGKQCKKIQWNKIIFNAANNSIFFFVNALSDYHYYLDVFSSSSSSSFFFWFSVSLELKKEHWTEGERVSA